MRLDLVHNVNQDLIPVVHAASFTTSRWKNQAAAAAAVVVGGVGVVVVVVSAHLVVGVVEILVFIY